MKFDVYFPFETKGGLLRPGVKPVPTEWEDIKKMMSSPTVIDKIDKYRAGEKEAKSELPAVCYVGRCTSTRAIKNMIPTQVVMFDVDHVEDPAAAFDDILLKVQMNVGAGWVETNLLLAAITPSGKGLRLLVFAQPEYGDDLQKQMAKYNEIFKTEEYGDFDAPCKDVTRLSFFFKASEILYENKLMSASWDSLDIIQNPIIKNIAYESENGSGGVLQVSLTPAKTSKSTHQAEPDFSEEEKAKFEAFEYRGTPIRAIIDKYLEHNGQPGEGEIHNYYNEMVKNFRCICDNNKRLLLYILPRFGHTIEECASQIRSICKVNTLSTLPKSFYFFLKDNGFYQPRDGKSYEGKMKEFMMSETIEERSKPPYLPPVFKQLVGICPPDFVDSAINSLLPILGTLTSYAQAKYPYDNRMHTTSFFSVIYAPPGTGKGFVERYLDLLFEDLKLRDFVQSQRENVYLRVINQKGANEKSPEMPHTSLRLIPPKNSEAEFLQKQSDNHGYHMFTYAAEMDSWAKGVKAAGGNKDDMLRIAWDNGEYGQQFKSASTFKGTVRLYWNVLITGTLPQIESYFKNVENGLVSRCTFTSIDNQEFAPAPVWGELKERDIELIRRFSKTCDERSYETPCTVVPEDLLTISDADFDKEVDWRFKFRDKITYDCSWIMPTIDQFHKDQMAKAALDVDKARDVFRRRVGVRGFRLALLCMCLWPNGPRKRELEKCTKFIKWWMERDLESTLKLWGAKYNDQADTTPTLVQRTLFNELADTFSKNDMYMLCMRQNIKTPLRRITFEWKKLGYIEQIDKDTFKKKKK